FVLSGAARRSCENTVAKYCACHGATAWNGLTFPSAVPQAGVSVPPVDAGFAAGAVVGFAAGAAGGGAAGALVGRATAAVGFAAGAVVGGAAGATVGAGGAPGAHACRRAAAPPRALRRSNWRRDSMVSTPFNVRPPVPASGRPRGSRRGARTGSRPC